MEYTEIFSESSVVENLDAQDMDSVLDELVDRLCTAYGLPPKVRKSVQEGLRAKVEQGATGAIGHGVAVPHVKIPEAKKTMAVFGRADHGIDFRAGDGAPVNLFFLIVGPDDAPEEHLNFMRWLATICRNPDFRRFALGCSTKSDMLELLEEMAAS